MSVMFIVTTEGGEDAIAEKSPSWRNRHREEDPSRRRRRRVDDAIVEIKEDDAGAAAGVKGLLP